MCVGYVPACFFRLSPRLRVCHHVGRCLIEPGVLAHAGFRARSAGPVQTWGLVTLGCAVGRRQRQTAARVAPPQRARSVLTDPHCSLGEGQAVLQANPSPPRAALSARHTPGQRRSSPRAEGGGTARGGPIALLGKGRTSGSDSMPCG